MCSLYVYSMIIRSHLSRTLRSRPCAHVTPRFAVVAFDAAEPRIAWYRDLRLSRKVNFQDTVSETILSTGLFRLGKVTTDRHIPAELNTIVPR